MFILCWCKQVTWYTIIEVLLNYIICGQFEFSNTYRFFNILIYGRRSNIVNIKVQLAGKLNGSMLFIYEII